MRKFVLILLIAVAAPRLVYADDALAGEAAGRPLDDRRRRHARSRACR